MQGIKHFVGGRLTQARLLSDGLSKTSLAQILEVAPSTITKWEEGIHYPNPEALEKISQVLHIPEHWFCREKKQISNPVFFARSKKKSLKSSYDRANEMLISFHEVMHIIEEWVNLPEVKILPVFNRTEALQLTNDQIIKAAESLRNQWGLGYAPISNLMLMTERAGILVTRFEIGYDEMDGTSSWINERPYIFVASDKHNYFRGRFDLAHEIGHIILHKNLTEQDRKDFYNKIEEQANLFSSSLLFPDASFAAECRYPTLESFISLKRRWGVSVASMIFKAHTLGLTSEDENKRLWRNYSYRKWRQGEPFDDCTPAEQPKVLKSAIEVMLSQGGFNKAALIDKIGLEYHLELMAGLPTGFLKEDFGQLVQIKKEPKSLANETKLTETGSIISFTKSRNYSPN